MRNPFVKPAAFLCLFVLWLFTLPASSQADTYYVRRDGGTFRQCTGRADAPYPGSGYNRPCAWSHPFWALRGQDESAFWRIKGGDTLVIGQGSYKMGIGAPNTAWCSTDWSWACRLPPLPSGPDPAHPTRIVGKGWQTGCRHKPQLWGTERAETVIDLTNTSNACLECLEITDHSGCANDHCRSSVRCQRNRFPYGKYADVGIYAADSSNVTLQNLNIHGLAWAGVHAGRLSHWTVKHVRLAGNGGVGWDGDIGRNSGNRGRVTFRRLKVEWNGCPETFPSLEYAHCWGQETCGGYGDGVGLARSGGRWLIEDSVFRYNVSDGLDLLYLGVDHPDSFAQIRRSKAYGNGGNQMKIGGAATIENSLIVSNCGFFHGRPFGQDMGNLDSGDHCRAGGAAVSFSLGRGKTASMVNSTVAGQGWALVETGCNTHDFPEEPACDGSEEVILHNNIFRGFQVCYLGYKRLTDFVGDGDPDHFTSAPGVDYNVIFNSEIPSPIGPRNLLKNPLLMRSNINAFDGRLQGRSPAIDTGLAVGSAGGLIPDHDIECTPRPQGNGVDRGAYEYH